jgi:hypothetical protein
VFCHKITKVHTHTVYLFIAAKDARFNAVYGDAGNAEKLAEYIITGTLVYQI